MNGEGNEPIVVRLAWPWRLVAPALIAVAATYPFLVRYVELRALDRGDVLPVVGILAFGLAYAWYCSHSARIEKTTITFKSFGRTQVLRDDDIASFEVTKSWVTATDRTGRKHRVSSYAPGSAALANRLKASAVGSKLSPLSQ